MTPFTYLIGWPHLNVFYYGVRYGKTCHPQDLWTTYFTSSKEVLAFRAEHGEPPLVEVRRIFSSKERAREWEHKVLRRMRVHRRTNFLNITTSKAPSMLGRAHSEETRRKIREGNLGKKRSAESRANNSKAQAGKTMSEQARRNIAEGHRGMVYSHEHRAAIAATKIGRKHWNNGKEARCCFECPGKDWVPGKLAKKKAAEAAF